MSTSDSPVKTPLYLDLYRKLRVKIESGEYAVGSKIPSEQEITEEYGVNRITRNSATAKKNAKPSASASCLLPG